MEPRHGELVVVAAQHPDPVPGAVEVGADDRRAVHVGQERKLLICPAMLHCVLHIRIPCCILFVFYLVTQLGYNRK